MRVVTLDGENLGVMKTSEAVKLAEEKGQDLVEVAPQGEPPVCKIMSWDKFQYNLQKKASKNKNKRKKQKELRFKTGIQKNAMERKIDHAKELLEDGHPVKVTLLKTRKLSKEGTNDLFNDILGYFEDYKQVSDVQKSRRMNYVIFKKVS